MDWSVSTPFKSEAIDRFDDTDTQKKKRNLGFTSEEDMPKHVSALASST